MEISGLATSIVGLKKEISELQSQLKGLTQGTKEYTDATNQLAQKEKDLASAQADMKQQLNESFGWTQKNTEANKEQTKTVNENINVLRQMRAEQKEIISQMAQLNLANKQGSEEYLKLAARAGKLRDAIDDASRDVRDFADDTKTMTDVLEGVKFGAAAFGAVSSGLSMLGVNGAKTEKILKTFAQTQQLLNSVQALQNTLMDKSSVVTRAYTALISKLGFAKKSVATETKAETAATVADTAAKTADTVATGAATVATKLFSAALKSIGIGLIIAAVAGLVEGLVWLNEKFNIVGKTIDGLKKGFQAVTDWLGFTSEAERKAAAEAEATAKKNKKLKASYDEVMKSAKSSMHSNDELVAKLVKYDKTIKDTTKSDKERLDAMRKVNQETGKEVFNLKDKQKALNNCGGAIEAYIKNMYTEMQVQALLAKAAHDYVNIIMLEANVKKAAAAGKDAPETKKQIANHKANIENYQKEAAELAKNIKIYKDYTTATSHATAATHEHTKSISEQDKQLQNIKKHRQELIDILKARVEADLEADFKLDITIKNKQEIKDSIKKQFEALFSDYNVMDEVFKNAEKSSKNIKERGELSKQLGGFSEDQISVAKENDKYKNAQAAVDAHLSYLRSKKDEAKKLYDQIASVPNQDPEVVAAALAQYQTTLDAYNNATAESTTKMQKTLVDILEDTSDKTSEEKKKWFSKKDLTTEEIIRGAQEAADGIASTLNTVADIKEKQIEQDVKNGKISEEQAKKEFEKVKALKVSTAVIDMLNGVVSAVSTAQSMGPIMGPILAAINSAAVIAAGTQNIKAIKATEFGGDGGGSTATVVPQAQPILDENRDLLDMSALSTAVNTGQSANTDTRVYVTEKDITDTQNKVKVAEQNSKF